MALPIETLIKNTFEKKVDGLEKNATESDRPRDDIEMPESNNASKDVNNDDSERPNESRDELPEGSTDYYDDKEKKTDAESNDNSNENKESGNNTYSDLNTMKKETGKTYGEIKEDKPPNSPNIAKWFENGGSIRIEKVDGKDVWTYIDKDGREVKYVDGYPEFPPEAKHPVIGDINIGEFTGDRNEDKKLYLKALEEQYGLTEIPEGYALHHDSKNGNMQLVKEDWHKEFTHAGGHSKYKEE